MTIHEPATLVTDCLLAAVAIGLAGRLHRRLSPNQDAARWWAWTFGCTAVSALVGGSFHGFAPEEPLTGIFALWWLVTLWLISLVSAAMTISWAHEVLRAPWRRMGFAFVAVRFLAFAVLAAAHPSFRVAILDYSSSLLLWLGAALVLRRAWTGWMLAAIALSAAAALVQQLHLAPSARFNHNDLYHVVQALGLVAYYRAARNLSPS